MGLLEKKWWGDFALTLKLGQPCDFSGCERSSGPGQR